MASGGLEISISGGAKLRELAKRIQAAGEQGLGREMANALKRAAKPVQDAVKGEYEELPARGGYKSTFSKSMKFRTTSRGEVRQASFRILFYGDGTHQRRDIKALESGNLRHPVFGRSRRVRKGPRRGTRDANPWAVTRVRGGYWKRGTERVADDVEKQMDQVLDDFIDRLK